MNKLLSAIAIASFLIGPSYTVHAQSDVIRSVTEDEETSGTPHQSVA